ncbi:hypothetical protein [Mucilaginibacter sp. HD30]
MANAVEDALNRAKADQKEKAMQTIDEAQRNINSASFQMGNFQSPEAADIISRNEQIIAEARRSIPFETMQSVDSVSPPMTTPPTHGVVNAEPIELNSNFKSNIENIEQGSGNNYLNQNAVDRANARQEQANPLQEPQEKSLGR